MRGGAAPSLFLLPFPAQNNPKSHLDEGWKGGRGIGIYEHETNIILKTQKVI
jgi:hypothetical protein